MRKRLALTTSEAFILTTPNPHCYRPAARSISSIILLEKNTKKSSPEHNPRDVPLIRPSFFFFMTYRLQRTTATTMGACRDRTLSRTFRSATTGSWSRRCSGKQDGSSSWIRSSPARRREGPGGLLVLRSIPSSLPPLLVHPVTHGPIYSTYGPDPLICASITFFRSQAGPSSPLSSSSLNLPAENRPTTSYYTVTLLVLHASGCTTKNGAGSAPPPSHPPSPRAPTLLRIAPYHVRDE